MRIDSYSYGRGLAHQPKKEGGLSHTGGAFAHLPKQESGLPHGRRLLHTWLLGSPDLLLTTYYSPLVSCFLLLTLTPYPYSLLLTSYFLPTPYSFPYSITARLVARLPGSKEGRCGFVHHVAATAKVPKLVHRGAEMVVGAAQALPQVGDASYILPEGVLP